MSGLSAERRRLIEELGATFDRLLAAIARRRGRDTHRSGSLGLAHLRLVAELHAMMHDRREAGGEAQAKAASFCSGARLARATGLSAAAVSEMLDHLERAGIVIRERSPCDRRARIVSLTERGREAYERKQRALFERGVAALADCANTEIAAAVKVVARLAETLAGEDEQAT
jgi:DNA-binding MarR family transcriptional regulator